MACCTSFAKSALPRKRDVAQVSSPGKCSYMLSKDFWGFLFSASSMAVLLAQRASPGDRPLRFVSEGATDFSSEIIFIYLRTLFKHTDSARSLFRPHHTSFGDSTETESLAVYAALENVAEAFLEA
mmetsp:Transcript_16040/g.22414  ORF Transcript_16040/g.22414 Transcript_16040/m.22414 type:complete len:126 (-) Transcript_16040:34-411(-)